MGRAERRQQERLIKKSQNKSIKSQLPSIKVTSEDLMKMKQEIADAAITSCMQSFYYALAWVLRKEEKFGKKK